MVVKVSCLTEFVHPGIQAIDPCHTTFGLLHSVMQIGFISHPIAKDLQLVKIFDPDLGPHFQPSLPIGTPADFLDELLGFFLRVLSKNCGDDLGFGD
jgi:hypothetical protein